MNQPELKKVLIIDDEIDICYLLSSIIKGKNYHPVYAGSISEAENLLKKELPDLVFLDNHLPDGVGVEFIGAIKKYDPLIKVVMITAYDTFNDRQKAANNGADFFISKPFTKRIIDQTIDSLNN